MNSFDFQNRSSSLFFQRLDD